MAPKRDHAGRPIVPRPAGRFGDLFEGFRTELDEHHDRRERLIKASRDVTALSKKIIFSLQRADGINKELPARVQGEVDKRLEEIQKILMGMIPDLQGQNRYRYARSLFGMEELVEALSMAHYLRTQKLITPEEVLEAITTVSSPAAGPHESKKDNQKAAEATEKADGKAESNQQQDQQQDTNMDMAPTDPASAFPAAARATPLLLLETDYVYGVADLFGEMMRFSTARTRSAGVLSADQSPHGRSVLQDIQELGFAFETLPKHGGDKKAAATLAKKLEGIRPSVRKVETLGYRLAIQSGEHPEGWVPDAKDEDVMEVG